MLKKSVLAVQVLLLAALNTPCFAQSEITNNQPVVGNLNDREKQIQAKMTADFQAGLIDADQLSILQRDFDGICTQEDDLRTRGSGMTDAGRKMISGKLDSFEVRLDKQANKSGTKKGN
jgi:hypothetical protein